MKVNKATCVVCSEEFEYERRGKPRSVCSPKCKQDRKNAARAVGVNGETSATCARCQLPFTYVRRGRERLYCTDRCKDAACYQPRVGLVAETCLQCGKPFERERRTGSPQKLCSPQCQDARKKASRAARYAAEQETAKRLAKGWALANAERVRENIARWQVANPERHRTNRRAKVLRYRARKASALTLPFTREQLDQRLSMWPGCWVCGDPAGRHVDHVKPLNKGGPHILANLRPICLPCNSRKRDRWPYTA